MCIQCSEGLKEPLPDAQVEPPLSLPRTVRPVLGIYLTPASQVIIAAILILAVFLVVTFALVADKPLGPVIVTYRSTKGSNTLTFQNQSNRELFLAVALVYQGDPPDDVHNHAYVVQLAPGQSRQMNAPPQGTQLQEVQMAAFDPDSRDPEYKKVAAQITATGPKQPVIGELSQDEFTTITSRLQENPDGNSGANL